MGAHHLQVFSRETIKPSSQTPHHLKNFKLSYLDQLAPSLYFSIIFFYQADELRGLLSTSNHVQISQNLKHSLSNTLTSFYQFAGRIKDNFTVDCNDAGVEFVDARVNAQLKDTILEDHPHPNMKELKQYLPVDPTAGGGTPLFHVQLTFFDCGGIAVGICFSHKIADCKSIMIFLNRWAAESRGDDDEAENASSLISFDMANYFPARHFLGSDIPRFPVSDEEFETRRFVFDKEQLAALKQAAASSSESTTVKNPTRVELVSAFIWKHFIHSAKLKNSSAKKEIVFAAFHAVNVRTRTRSPEILENVFGNGIMSAIALISNNNVDDASDDLEEFRDLVRKLRSSIRKIGDDDYIAKARNGDGYLDDLFEVLFLLKKGELEWCRFSSWCSFPVYEVDYGWGNPVWLCTTALPLKNVIILVRSKCGESIEAWVNMNQDNLRVLETQIQLISTKPMGL